MGVSGLWALLEPTGKAIDTSRLNGKVVAVDVSIWLHQSIRGMRTQSGELVQNAHLLTVFSRVCTLLALHVKPVFVFDGAAPALKTQTLASRRKRREKGADEIKRAQQKLLENHLRKHVLKDSTPLYLPRVHDDDDKEPDIFTLPKSTASPKRKRAGDGGSSAGTAAASSSAVTVISDDDDVAGDSSDEENQAVKQFVLDTRSVDVFSDTFAELPPEIQHEIITEMMAERKDRSRSHKINSSVNSDSFCDQQLMGVAKRNRLATMLEDVRERLLLADTIDGIAARKIVSEENTTYILERRPTLQHHGSSSGTPTLKDAGEKKKQEEKTLLRGLSHDQEEPSGRSAKRSRKDADSGVPATERKLSAMQLLRQRQERAEQSATDSDSSLSFAGEWSGDDEDQPAVPGAASRNSPTKDTEEVVTEHKESEKGPIQDDEPALRTADGVQGQAAPPAAAAPAATTTVTAMATEQGTGTATAPQAPPPAAATGEEADSGMSTASEPEDDEGVDITESLAEHTPDSAPAAVAAAPTVAVPASTVSHLQQQSQQQQSQQQQQQSQQLTQPESVPSEAQASSSALTTTALLHHKAAAQPVPAVVTIDDHEDGDDEAEEDDDEDDDLESVGAASPDAVLHEDKTVEDATAPAAAADRAPASPDDLRDLVPGFDLADLAADESAREAAVRALDEDSQQLRKTAARAARAAAGVTAEMNTDVQNLLQLFGLPYIIAPQEAEAQCAQLELLGLVDGSVTDDNDVFLFGGKTVYRHLFSRTRSPMQFTATGIQALLGLDREKLVFLAYLLGSDYTRGVRGAGPVTSMEVLSEFPGQTGLEEFKAWLDKARTAKSIPIGESKIRRQLRSMVKSLQLPDGFPNPLVKRAYLDPVVEKSDEKFTWGEPDMKQLEEFTEAKFNWSKDKTKEQLAPVLKALGEKEHQTSITTFFKTKYDRLDPITSGLRLKRAVTKVNPNKKLPECMDAPAAPSTASPRRKKAAAGKQSDSPQKKRVLSAYQLWLQETRSQIVTEHPDLTPTEVIRKAGELWRTMPTPEKQQWREKQADHKAKIEAYNATLDEASELAKICVQDLLDAEQEEDTGRVTPAEEELDRRKRMRMDQEKAGAKPEQPLSHLITINRAPVLTLWVAVVACRSGWDWESAVTFGRYVANKFATTKGRSLGLIDDRAAGASAAGDLSSVHVFGQDIPVQRNDDGVVVARSEKDFAISPTVVIQYLKRAFGPQLKPCRAAMKELAESFASADELERQAYALYCQFRPSVSAGVAGWGQMGHLDLHKLKEIADENKATHHDG